MDVTKRFQKALNCLDYRNAFGKVLLVAMYMNYIFLFLNTTYGIIYNWNENVINRYMAVKDINVILNICSFTMDYTFYRRKVLTIFTILQYELPIHSECQLEIRKEKIKHDRKSQNTSLNYMRFFLMINIFLITSVPMIVSIHVLLSSKTNVSVRDLPLPIVAWYPKGYETLLMYGVFYLCHVIFYLYALVLIYCVFGSTTVVFRAVVTELELLCISVNDIDSIIYNKEVLEDSDKRLKGYLRYLVQIHQTICRHTILLNESVGFVLTSANQCICFQICIYLYCTFEYNSIVGKIGYLCIVFLESSILFIYCYNGQKIINKGEELRRTLAECSWLDKPLWFKKSLVIMLTRANIPLQVKPYGLYILNLNNFATIMNAAYSYFNMLRTVQHT